MSELQVALDAAEAQYEERMTQSRSIAAQARDERAKAWRELKAQHGPAALAGALGLSRQRVEQVTK